jgi:hypothetical protein
MSREDVYKAIDTERDYQEKLIRDPSRPGMVEDLSLGDILTAMRHNLAKAEASWYAEADPHTETMTYLRKVGALAVQAGEVNGMPIRS